MPRAHLPTILVAALALSVAAGCRDVSNKSVVFDPRADVFSPPPSGEGTSGRTFECTSKAADGSCNVNECKQGPGGATFDCASFAAACVDAGEHWSGTKEGGKCTRVL